MWSAARRGSIAPMLRACRMIDNLLLVNVAKYIDGAWV